MKNIVIIYSEYSPVIDAIKYNLSEYTVTAEHIKDYKRNKDDYDLIICLNNIKVEGKAITCHHSLLPSFNCEDPEKEAIIQGVKVTGITIYRTDTGKIITQYPVFIDNDMHYDNLKRELSYLEQTLLPVTAKKIINNEPIEMRSLLNNKCCNNRGCTACSH